MLSSPEHCPPAGRGDARRAEDGGPRATPAPRPAIGHHDPALDPPAEQYLGLHGIDSASTSTASASSSRLRQIDVRSRARILWISRLLTRGCCGQTIVELDHRERFDKRCRTARRNIEQQAREVATGPTTDRQAVAIPAQSRRRIRDDVPVGTTDAFESPRTSILARRLRAATVRAQATRCPLSVPSRPRRGRHGVDRDPSCREDRRRRLHAGLRFGIFESSTAHGRNPAGQDQQGQQLVGLADGGGASFQPRQASSTPAKPTASPSSISRSIARVIRAARPAARPSAERPTSRRERMRPTPDAGVGRN